MTSLGGENLGQYRFLFFYFIYFLQNQDKKRNVMKLESDAGLCEN